MSTSVPIRLRPVDLGKPRMRGWLHAYAFFVAVAAGVVLCAVAATRPGWTALVSCTVYSVTVCGLFGTSALYHRRVWSERGYRTMRRLDHSMIFVFIAGTYTPFCLLLLSGRSAAVLLVVVWSGAVAGVALKLVWPHAPRWVSAPLYLALGWVAVAVLPDILDRGGVTVLALLVAGGAAYSIGAVCYALRRPNPWPTVFGHHELFHACTLVAAICHHVAIYFALFA
ncbi:hemolysin III family protein [Plantactinospora sp. S1510]|uniref:Hemolysin III family protein n=1 Tax=Plantactinospora alkalitolerans TaxID=2789879 RepID=A0ABS0GXI8_9ACTN|nr:hemolysin III family protein [Plantactinospora alkalitolerans]MBF9130688.1 hemolysin III family protein [Plantactinospora alkalitolerans]